MNADATVREPLILLMKSIGRADPRPDQRVSPSLFQVAHDRRPHP